MLPAASPRAASSRSIHGIDILELCVRNGSSVVLNLSESLAPCNILGHTCFRWSLGGGIPSRF